MASTPYVCYSELTYLPQREIEMSDRPRHTPVESPHHAAPGRGALGAGTGTGNDPPQLRLRAVRRAEPDVRKLVEWVLNITQARYDAHLAGEPDPYGLPAPEGFGPVSDARGRMEPEALHQRRSTA